MTKEVIPLKMKDFYPSRLSFSEPKRKSFFEDGKKTEYHDILISYDKETFTFRTDKFESNGIFKSNFERPTFSLHLEPNEEWQRSFGLFVKTVAKHVKKTFPEEYKKYKDAIDPIKTYEGGKPNLWVRVPVRGDDEFQFCFLDKTKGKKALVDVNDCLHSSFEGVFAISIYCVRVMKSTITIPMYLVGGKISRWIDRRITIDWSDESEEEGEEEEDEDGNE